jgi:biotin carboxylase
LSYPPLYSKDTLDNISSLIKEALDAVGLDSGASHSEILMTRKGPFIVEVAGRGGGFGIFSDIIPFVSGVDAVKQCINISMGFDVDIKAKHKKAAVLRFFNPPLGKIKRISGLEEARKLPGVFKVELNKKEGDVFYQIRRDGERPGLMITFGENREEAIKKADLVESTVKFEIEELR